MTCLFPSEPADRNVPAVHASPASKTFSKTAATPWNGSVTPASTVRSPAAPNKNSSPASRLPGRRSTAVKRQCVVTQSGHQRAALYFYSRCSGVTFFFAYSYPIVWDCALCERYSVNELRLLAFPLPGSRSTI